MSINLNKEWSFVQNEITSSNKGRSRKGRMLFELQILLMVLGWSKNPREREMLSLCYQKRKEQYKI